MSHYRERIRRLSAVGAALSVLLVPTIGSTEVRINATPSVADNVALERMLRDQLAASPRVVALNARVTIGAEAFRDALARNDDQPLVAAYLSSTEFAAVLANRPRPPNVTAVFSNPDPLDELALAQAVLGKAKLAAFDSPAVHSMVEPLTDRGVTAIPATAGVGVDALLRAADPFDVIIVLPDPDILNRSNVDHVVRTLYLRRKVLIGYSATLTRVGSLASVHPTPQGIAQNVKNVLERYAIGDGLRSPVFVREVDVSVNERLARSLNIVLPERAQILEAIRTNASTREATP